MISPSLYATLPSSKSIRLLRLHPDSDEATISCSLVLVDDYASTSEFDALSYCWGDTKDTTIITCNKEPVLITKSLDAALRCLRRRGQGPYLWADALCINQDDNLERNQQVSIMAQIYRQASRISVWLGEADDETAPALDIIEKVWV
jgi:Heterokaryon incompatibility protein (HET)